MKRFFFFALIAFSIISLAACHTDPDDDTSSDGPTDQPQQQENKISVSENEIVFAHEGGSKVITFSSPVIWQAETDKTWCKISPTTGLSGKECSLTISVPEHSGDNKSDREATLTIKPKEGSTQKATIKICQKPEGAITLTSEIQEFGAEGGPLEIKLQANYDNISYEIVYNNGEEEWITNDATRGNMVDHTFNFKVAPNENLERRSATITFKGYDQYLGEASEEITVYQKGSEPSIILSQGVYKLNYNEHTFNIVVQSNIKDVEIKEKEEYDWIDIESDVTRAMDSRKFEITVEEYSGDNNPGPRYAYLSVTSETVPGLTSEIAIIQYPQGVINIDGDKVRNIIAEGEEIEINVDHNVDFDVEFDFGKSSEAWIEDITTLGTRNSGLKPPTTKKFKILGNDTGKQREGYILFIDKDDTEHVESVKIIQAQDNRLLVKNGKERNISSAGETIRIEVEQNIGVEIEIPDGIDWVKQTSTRSLSTKEYFFEVLPNDGHDSRETYITFFNKEHNLSDEVKIIQAAKDDIVIAEKDKHYDIEAKGNTIEIPVNLNVECGYEIMYHENDELKNWITEVTTRGLTAKLFRFDIALNEDYDSRDAIIVFYAKNNSNLRQYVTIHQAHKDALIIEGLDNNTIPISDEKQEIKFTIQANNTVTITDPEVDWLHRKITRGLESQTIYYDVDANEEYNSRSAVIIVKSADKEEKITVIQAQKDAIVLAPDKITVSNEGEDFKIKVGHNVEYDYEILEDAKTWISEVKTRGWVEKDLTFHAALYDGDDSRSGTIKFTSKDKAKAISQTITIIQTQKDALIINNRERKIDNTKQTVEFEVRHNVDIGDIDIPVKWVRRTTTRTMDTTTLTFEVDANSSYESRTATITVHSKDGSLEETITITQAQKDAIVIAKNEYPVDGNSNKIEIEVGSNVKYDYEISDNAKTWISRVVSRAFETETLTFQIAENPDYVERRGTITFTSTDKISQTITVIQAGYDATEPRHNEIWYTSSDGKIVITKYTNVFGAKIVSNTYREGKGVIKFDGDVTRIGVQAFRDCTSLTSITIPDSVTEIGYEAFSSCSSLTSITIPDSVTEIGAQAFLSCSSLTSITIPDSVTKIGNYAFQHCSLTSITIPDSVTEIGTQAFYCSSLKAFYGKFASEDNRCLIIDGVLNSFAPADLTSYTIPDSVTEIGYEAFAQCSRLTSITIPDSVITIGDSAFSSCSRLTSVTIPDSVTEIGYYAFAYCSNLASVYCKSTTPPAVTKTSNYNVWRAFDNNAPGRMIYVPAESVDAYKAADGWREYADAISADKPANNQIWYTTTDGKSINKYLGESYPTNIFGGASIATHTYENGRGVIHFNRDVTMIGVQAFFNCDNLKSITIPQSVTSIDRGAFNSCKSLTDIEIPETVTSIGSSAFASCTSLPAIVIPESITEIKERTFESCTSLTEITIPSKVTLVESYAFDKCSNLKVVHCLPTEPPTAKRLYWYAFSNNASGRKIYVPAESVNRYKSAEGWRDYASDILPEGAGDD